MPNLETWLARPLLAELIRGDLALSFLAVTLSLHVTNACDLFGG